MCEREKERGGRWKEKVAVGRREQSWRRKSCPKEILFNRNEIMVPHYLNNFTKLLI